MRHTISYMAAAFMLLFSLNAGAQALPFVAADFDAASLGRAGTSLTATSGAAYSAFGNPAAVPFSEDRLDVGAGYTMWAPTKGNVVSAGGAFNLKDRLGVAAGFSYGLNPAYDITDGGGAVSGRFSPTDMQAGIGLSYRFLKFLSVGANISYATSSLSSDISYGAVAADVFVMARLAGLRVTAGVSDLGSKVTSASGARFALPTSVALGAGYGMTFAQKHGIDLMLDADYFLDGGFAASAGVEYAMNGMVFARAGYRYGGESPLPSYASAGAGVRLLGIRLDIAYIFGSEVMGNTLAVGLGYSF